MKTTVTRKKQSRSTRTREEWNDMFWDQAAKSDIGLEPDEKITQCKEPYPEYWYVTDRARVFSIWNNKIKQLKPYADPNTGKKRDQLVWTYHYRNRKITSDKICWDHFGEPEWDDWDGKLDLHHIFAMKNFDEGDCFEASRIENIQAIPRDPIHQFATMFDNDKEEKWLDKKYRKLSDKELKLIEKLLPYLIFPDGILSIRKVEDGLGNTGVKVDRGKNIKKIESIVDPEENALIEGKDFVITDKYIFVAEDNGEFLEKNKNILDNAVDKFLAEYVNSEKYKTFDFKGVIVRCKKNTPTAVDEEK